MAFFRFAVSDPDTESPSDFRHYSVLTLIPTTGDHFISCRAQNKAGWTDVSIAVMHVRPITLHAPVMTTRPWPLIFQLAALKQKWQVGNC